MNSFYFQSPIGCLLVLFNNHEIISLNLVDKIENNSVQIEALDLMEQIKAYLLNYFLGKAPLLNIPLSASKSAFFQKTYSECLKIPNGKTLSYSDLAKKIGNDKAYRAVALAMAKNEKLILIPCHRVLAKHGLGGYALGLWRKKFLLALEKGYYKSLGLHSSKVHLVPHNQIWSYLYQIEKEAILSEISLNQSQIEHFGSTSIEGLSAKPVLDIILGIEEGREYEIIRALEKLGYIYKANFDPKEWHFMVKGLNDHITHHLHICHYQSFFFKSHVAFRDYLLKHPDEKEKYQNLKLELQDKYSEDRPSYTKAKDLFIKDILMKCGF